MIKNNKTFCCRWSPTLGALESTHQKIWKTKNYNPKTDIDKPCVWFGLYGLPDFYSLWRHKGKRYILWAGTDLLHFKNGYWLEDGGEIKIDNKGMAKWLNKYCENWVENKPEQEELKKLGIKSKVCPSFLGDVNKFNINYKWNDKPKLYTSVSGDDFERYGWDKIPMLAQLYPDVEFHMYGSNNYHPIAKEPNIINHGRVPKAQMNREIKKMQGALRLIKIEGFSEIVAKSILMGQYPVSLIDYPYMLKVSEIGKLKTLKKPNIKGREYYLKKLNKFVWAT